MPVGVQPVRLLAPAKLTLRLRVTGVRPDGYHLIDAEMVSLDLCDELLVYPGDTSSVEIVPEGAYHRRLDSDAPATAWNIPADQTNLVMRALEFVGRTAHVEIRKRIPPGAGLGGGSADAAAILRWANRATAARAGGAAASSSLVTPRDAASLGADVAFCLVGGRARVSGIGEIVERVPFRDQSFVLLTPAMHVDTAAVYRRWDELDSPTREQANNLEPAALAAYPELAMWREALESATGRSAQLAGSGGTWFVTAPHRALADGGAGLPAHDGVSACVARAIGRLC